MSDLPSMLRLRRARGEALSGEFEVGGAADGSSRRLDGSRGDTEPLRLGEKYPRMSRDGAQDWYYKRWKTLGTCACLRRR